MAALSNLGYRNERAYVEARNDVRWERRMETLNRGRDMIAQNIQFSKLAFGIFGDLGKQAGLGAAGAVRYLGYSWNKNETQYPTLARGIETVETVTTPARPAPQQPVIRSGIVWDTNSDVGRAAKPEDMR